MEQEALAFGYPRAAYGKIMEAMGYTPNRRPFLDLARLLTEESLYENVSSLPGHAGETVIEALFLGMGSLFPQQVPIPQSDKETGEYLSELLSIWKSAEKSIDAPVMDSEEWSLKGLRPANHPRRRLSGMARLMMRHREKKLFGTLLDYMKNDWQGEEAEAARGLSRMLVVPAEGYWGKRFNFGGKTLNRPSSLIGEERVEIALVNAVIPVLLVYSRREEEAELEANLHQLYGTLRPSPSNRTVRFISARLFGEESPPHPLKLTARRQQGLIQIYHDFCAVHEGGCGNCLFPQLLQHLQ